MIRADVAVVVAARLDALGYLRQELMTNALAECNPTTRAGLIVRGDKVKREWIELAAWAMLARAMKRGST